MEVIISNIKDINKQEDNNIKSPSNLIILPKISPNNVNLTNVVGIANLTVSHKKPLNNQIITKAININVVNHPPIFGNKGNSVIAQISSIIKEMIQDRVQMINKYNNRGQIKLIKIEYQSHPSNHHFLNQDNKGSLISQDNNHNFQNQDSNHNLQIPINKQINHINKDS